MNADVQAGCAETEQLNALLTLHQAALESMPHGMCVLDAELRVVLFNERFLQMYRASAEIVRAGLPLRRLIEHVVERGNYPTARPEDVYARLIEQLARGEAFQVRRQLPTGATYATQYQPVAGGGWVVLLEDFTERQRQEYDLRVQFERFDQAINHMSHGLCVVDADNRLVLHNKLFLEMYELSEELVKPGVWMRDIFEHAAQRGSFPGHLAELVWQRRLEKMAARKPFQQRQHLHNGRDYILHYHPTADGGWVTLCEDVTARYRMEQDLREQNLQFDAALENMAHGLCMFNADNRLMVCNDQYVKVFGADPDVVKPGITLREIFEHGVTVGLYPGLTVDELLARRLAMIARGEIVSYDQKVADGRTIEVKICPMTNGGWLGTFDDVTARRRVEAEHAAATAEVHKKNLLLDAALENMAHGLCVFDKDWRIVVHNRQYLDIYGLPPERARPGTPLVELVRHSLQHGLHSSKSSAEEFITEFRQRVEVDREPFVHRRLADGRLISIRHQPLEDGGWVGTFEDITERERAAEQLREQYRLFDAALNNMGNGLAMFDADMRVIVCNARYYEMFGMSPDVVKPGVTAREVLEHSLAIGNYRHTNITLDEFYDDYIESLNSGDTVLHRHLADGRVIRVAHEKLPQGGWVAIYEDITERHRAEQSIAHMARHDALTELPNRLLLREKMAEGLARVETFGESMAVFYLDLDNFKGVNDTLGHPIGDKLLGAVADRIRGSVREGDTVARLGGDEFAVLQCNSNPEAAGALARRLVALLSEPVDIDGHEINPGVSIGIAFAPADGHAADHLMKCADLALYRAKAEGRATFRFFEQDMDARIQARRALEIDLRRALAAGEFTLVYQPQINLAANELVAMEALLRWTHAERGPVPPSEFIPLAEEMGLIGPLGEWVLREACNEAARWPEPIKIAVNLSPVQFRNRSLVATVTQALAAAGLAPSRLELEITEAVLLQNDDAIVTMLHQLRALGVRISMDDFGTGYSSLSYLRSFPFDKIKIDRSFIKDIDRNRDSAVIIRAIASLGESLGIDTTAEGVETAEQLDVVRRAGCTEMQGYLASPPRPVRDLPALFARWRNEVAAA